MSFNLRMEFWGWTIGRLRLSTFPPKVHSGPFLIGISSVRNRYAFYSKIGQLYSSMLLYLEIGNSNFPLFFRYFFCDCNSVVLILFSEISVVARKLNMTCPIRIFEKFHFTPKSCFSRCSKSNFQIRPIGTYSPDSRSLSSSRVTVCQ